MGSKKPYYHAVAFISDIHSNIEALEAVLEDIKKLNVSAIYCLGDLVGYGPDPEAVVNRIMTLKESGKIIEIVCGNHDYGVYKNDFSAFNSSAKLSNTWTVDQLKGKPEMDFLGEIVEDDYIKEVGRFKIVHSTWNPEPQKWDYLRSKNASQNFDERKITFVGHSHMPAIYSKYSSGKDWNPIELFSNDGYCYIPKPKSREMKLGGRTLYRLKVPGSFPTMLINIGSVGQPRDESPMAKYVVYMTVDFNDYIEYRQVGYAHEKTVEKLKDRGLSCDKEIATRICTGGPTRFDDRHPCPEWFPIDPDWLPPIHEEEPEKENETEEE